MRQRVATSTTLPTIVATARLRRRLEASVRDDADVQHLLDEVVARRLDPASAAGSILERDDANGAAP